MCDTRMSDRYEDPASEPEKGEGKKHNVWHN